MRTKKGQFRLSHHIFLIIKLCRVILLKSWSMSWVKQLNTDPSYSKVTLLTLTQSLSCSWSMLSLPITWTFLFRFYCTSRYLMKFLRSYAYYSMATVYAAKFQNFYTQWNDSASTQFISINHWKKIAHWPLRCHLRKRHNVICPQTNMDKTQNLFMVLSARSWK